MNREKQRVLQEIENNAGGIVNSLQEITRFPSVMENEKDAQMYYAGILEKMQLNLDIWEPKLSDTRLNPHFLAIRDDYQGSPNVVGLRKGKGGGKSLILNGHIDVVPAGDGWDDSPWSGKLLDGKVFGRGTSDMKAGLIANAMAIKAIMDSGIELKGDIIIESVIGEETGGAGTLSALNRGYKADAALISEPTDLRVCPVSMGAMWFRIIVKGLAAHAGTSYLGVNAIVKAGLIIQKLEEFNQKRAVQRKHELYKHMPIPFSVNIGTVKGGVFPTSVPDLALIEGRMGVSPDEGIREARQDLEDAVYEVTGKDAWLKEHPPEVEWFGFCLSSGGINKDHILTRTVGENFQFVDGNKPVIIGTPWGTDAGALIRYGNIPTVIFGPGPGETAHKENEYVEVEKLLKATKIIACTTLDWCGYE